MQSTLLSIADSIPEVAQEFGNSTDKVVSQKALNNVFNIIKWDDERSDSERLARAIVLDVYMPNLDVSKGESIAISALTNSVKMVLYQQISFIEIRADGAKSLILYL